ncbi:MAG: hypothetical protein M1823_004533 [Watsoniomyces obsoletus]|nr:MAG: hypothetical protein M1823_004533 [Watsoniomyces obsoletus]
MVAAAHQMGNGGHIPIPDEPGKEWSIFKGNKGSRTEDQEVDWRGESTVLPTGESGEPTPAKDLGGHRVLSHDDDPTRRAVKPKVASDGVQALAGVPGVAALNNIRELVGAGGRVGKALLPSQIHLTNPEVENELMIVLDPDLRQTTRHRRRLRVQEEAAKMAKAEYFLELLLCFQTYLRLKRTITREKFELHRVPLPRTGVADRDAMTRDLFIYMTHDRATLAEEAWEYIAPHMLAIQFQ